MNLFSFYFHYFSHTKFRKNDHQKKLKMHIDQFPDERKLMRSSCVYFIKKLETRIKESQNNEVGDEEMVKKEMHECFISNT